MSYFYLNDYIRILEYDVEHHEINNSYRMTLSVSITIIEGEWVNTFAYTTAL